MLRHNARMTRWPCPCCGHLTLDEGPGEYDLCPVCYWEDDPEQLRWPDLPNRANGLSLMEAQATYQRIGAMSEGCLDSVREPLPHEPSDRGWRPFDPVADNLEIWVRRERQAPWPDDLAALYWWRANYWRKDGS